MNDEDKPGYIYQVSWQEHGVTHYVTETFLRETFAEEYVDAEKRLYPNRVYSIFDVEIT